MRAFRVMLAGVLESLPITLEVTPPTLPRPAILLRRATCLGSRARRVNVIERGERWSSLEASLELATRGLEPVWHLANRGRSLASIETELARAAAGGVRHVLCIRGEYKAPDRDDTPLIREVVRLARRSPFEVAVTANPFAVHGAVGRSRALANLDAKIDAGATRVQMQVSFDLESLRPFAEHLKDRTPEVSIVPMAMPVLSPAAALRLSRRLGVPIPAALIHRLERIGCEAGWEHFGSFARAVAESPLYDGLAIMTPIDPKPTHAARLRASLRG